MQAVREKSFVDDGRVPMVHANRLQAAGHTQWDSREAENKQPCQKGAKINVEKVYTII